MGLLIFIIFVIMCVSVYRVLKMAVRKPGVLKDETVSEVRDKDGKLISKTVRSNPESEKSFTSKIEDVIYLSGKKNVGQSDGHVDYTNPKNNPFES